MGTGGSGMEDPRVRRLFMTLRGNEELVTLVM